MSVLRVLDLCCCEGGVAKGYADAGFVPYGVDMDPKYRKRYPYAFHAGDAVLVLAKLLAGEGITFTHKDGTLETLYLKDFAFIHASPPCQHATVATSALRGAGKEYPRLIEPIRARLHNLDIPYVIENVRGADLLDPVELCGCMWDMKAVDTDGITLYLQRPRRFESNLELTAPREHDHAHHEWVGGSYGGARRDKYEAKFVRKGGYVPSIKVQQALLGIDWMTQYGMFQSVPPRYTRHLGEQIMLHLSVATLVA